MTHGPAHISTESAPALHLDTRWVRWLVSQAQQRGQAVQAAFRDDDGSCQLCDTETLWGMAEADDVWRVTQRHGCKGPRTRIELRRRGRLLAALLEDRALGCAEGAGWRALVLEALVLGSRDTCTS